MFNITDVKRTAIEALEAVNIKNHLPSYEESMMRESPKEISLLLRGHALIDLVDTGNKKVSNHVVLATGFALARASAYRFLSDEQIEYAKDNGCDTQNFGVISSSEERVIIQGKAEPSETGYALLCGAFVFRDGKRQTMLMGHCDLMVTPATAEASTTPSTSAAPQIEDVEMAETCQAPPSEKPSTSNGPLQPSSSDRPFTRTLPSLPRRKSSGTTSKLTTPATTRVRLTSKSCLKSAINPSKDRKNVHFELSYDNLVPPPVILNDPTPEIANHTFIYMNVPTFIPGNLAELRRVLEEQGIGSYTREADWKVEWYKLPFKDNRFCYVFETRGRGDAAKMKRLIEINNWTQLFSCNNLQQNKSFFFTKLDNKEVVQVMLLAQYIITHGLPRDVDIAEYMNHPYHIFESLKQTPMADCTSTPFHTVRRELNDDGKKILKALIKEHRPEYYRE